MRAIFTTGQRTSVRVNLDAGEALGLFEGPAEIFVPVDPANGEYAALRALGIAVTVSPLAGALPSISDRQFGEGLWRDGLISYEDYLGFVGPGTVPPALAAIIDTLPDDDTGRPTPRKVARGLVTGAKSYEFSNPLVDTIRQAQGWTDAQLREHWSRWAGL